MLQLLNGQQWNDSERLLGTCAWYAWYIINTMIAAALMPVAWLRPHWGHVHWLTHGILCMTGL